METPVTGSRNEPNGWELQYASSSRCLFDTRERYARGRAGRLMSISIDMQCRHGHTMQFRDGPAEVCLLGYSLLPIVPATLRTEHHAIGLERFHILWEVEQWADQQIRAVPDRDPYLLLHIRADTFAVIAEWDLTPIERMVMAGRRQA